MDTVVSTIRAMSIEEHSELVRAGLRRAYRKMSSDDIAAGVTEILRRDNPDAQISGSAIRNFTSVSKQRVHETKRHAMETWLRENGYWSDAQSAPLKLIPKITPREALEMQVDGIAATIKSPMSDALVFEAWEDFVTLHYLGIQEARKRKQKGDGI